MDWQAVLSILLRLLAVVALVLLNGFFVAAEFALVKVRDTQLRPLINRGDRSEEHTSELQSQSNLVCRLLLEKKKHRWLPDGFQYNLISALTGLNYSARRKRLHRLGPPQLRALELVVVAQRGVGRRYQHGVKI